MKRFELFEAEAEMEYNRAFSVLYNWHSYLNKNPIFLKGRVFEIHLNSICFDLMQCTFDIQAYIYYLP